MTAVGPGGAEKHGPALRIFGVARSQEVKNALSSAASGMNGTQLEVRIGTLKDLGVMQIHHEKPDIVILDLDVGDPQEMALLNRVVVDRSGVGPVLATAAAITPEHVRRLVRQGIDDFLPQPLTQRDVLDAFDGAHRKLRQIRIAGRPVGKVISFVKASGGVGASTLAMHTAYNLLHPSRKETAEVCLIDLDLHYGTAALYVDLENKAEVVDIIREPERLDADLLRTAVSVHKSGLRVLTAPRAPVPLEALTPEAVARLLNYAREEYQYVVVDLPPALTTWMETVLTASDQVMVVTELSVANLRQTRRLLEILNEEGLYSLPLAVVLNRYKRRWGDRFSWRDGEKALGRRFDYHIPSDYGLVVDALNQGRPIYEIKRRSGVGKAIRAMTDSCLQGIKSREAAEVVAPTAPR